MSSFYDDASLVVIPSGYKTSKIYAEKPTDGSGDLTFTRASGATRVASNGLIEKVRTNICLQSNTFSNAAWNKIAQGAGTTPVVTANYTTDPFGGNNGWRLQCNLGGGTTTSDRSWLQQDIAGTTVPTTVSVYAKLNSAGSATFALTNASTDNVTITSTDWVRISTVRTAATTVYSFRIGLIGGVGQSGTLDISIAFAQLETGDIATNYIPTTTAAVSVGPVSNLPRLDYLGSSCPRLLLEPQRTNLALYSEQLNNANWTNIDSTISANTTATLDPAGYYGADKIVENSATSGHSVYQAISVTNGATYTLSVFAKAAERTKVWLDLFGGSNAGVFDLSTGTVVAVSSGASAVITQYANGWYKCAVTAVAPDPTLYINVGPTTGNTTNNQYAGNGTSGIYIWGAQLEAGAYATSYIPTLGASVTRVADIATKTGITSLIGQTEGTLFAEINWVNNSVDSVFATLSDGTTNNRIHFGNAATGSWYLYSEAGAATQVNITTPTPVNGKYKIAVAYKLNDYAFYINGVQIAVDNSATVPATSQINVGGFITAGLEQSVNQALVFKTRLTNAQLAELTTL